MTKPIFKAVLFDLDGTLTESAPGILRCIKETLTAFELPVPPPEELRSFIGPPLTASFRQLRVSQEECVQMARHFRTLYNEKGVFENALYPYAAELLEHLRSQGVKVGIATAKPLSQAGLVVKHFGLAPLLDCVSAASEDEGEGKGTIIARALDALSVPPGDAVMVGDTRHDVLGAAAAGASFIGILHGYGARREMELEGAVCFASDLKELEPMLLK